MQGVQNPLHLHDLVTGIASVQGAYFSGFRRHVGACVPWSFEVASSSNSFVEDGRVAGGCCRRPGTIGGAEEEDDAGALEA